VPILLLISLTAPALFRLPRWLSVPAAFYCLTFSLAVCTLIEVSPPQLLWAAGRLNTDGFLRQALPVYAASQALQGKAAKTDRILALDGCPAPYAPFAGTVRCVYRTDFNDSAPRLLDEIKTGAYRFVILPPTPLRQHALLTLSAKEVYSDVQFTVYDLNPK
jgi:hypothetical protein